jgi:predicted transcriptional regulator
MSNSNPALSNNVSLSADIIAAYVSHNSVTPLALPPLIEAVFEALSKLGVVEAVQKTPALVPATPIQKSITPGFLIASMMGRDSKPLSAI